MNEKEFKGFYEYLQIMIKKNQNLINNIIKGVFNSSGNERFFIYFINMILEIERKGKDENFVSTVLKNVSKYHPECLLPFINDIFNELYSGLSKRNVIEILGDICLIISKKNFNHNLVEVLIMTLNEKDTFVRQKSISFLKEISFIYKNMKIDILVKNLI